MANHGHGWKWAVGRSSLWQSDLETGDDPTETEDDFFYSLTCTTWTLDDPDALYEFEDGVDTPTAWHLVFERQ
jgi:hypothetical protein